MDNTLTTIKFWNKNYGLAHKIYPNPMVRMDYEFMKIISPFLATKKGGKLLELGCGDSYWLPYYAKLGFEIAGIDYSLERLNSVKSKLDFQGLKGELLCRDFRQIPYGWVNKFDVVYSNGVVEHFANPYEIISIFSRYLKDDGIMITTVPHLKGIWGNIQKKISPEIYNGFVCLDLKDAITQHEMGNLNVIFASYYRLLDFSILNFALVPSILRKMVYGGIIAYDLFLNLMFRIYQPKNLPESFYPDTIIVAKKYEKIR